MSTYSSSNPHDEMSCSTPAPLENTSFRNGLATFAAIGATLFAAPGGARSNNESASATTDSSIRSVEAGLDQLHTTANALESEVFALKNESFVLGSANWKGAESVESVAMTTLNETVERAFYVGSVSVARSLLAEVNDARAASGPNGAPALYLSPNAIEARFTTEVLSAAATKLGADPATMLFGMAALGIDNDSQRTAFLNEHFTYNDRGLTFATSQSAATQAVARILVRESKSEEVERPILWSQSFIVDSYSSERLGGATFEKSDIRKDQQITNDRAKQLVESTRLAIDDTAVNEYRRAFMSHSDSERAEHSTNANRLRKVAKGLTKTVGLEVIDKLVGCKESSAGERLRAELDQRMKAETLKSAAKTAAEGYCITRDIVSKISSQLECLNDVAIDAVSENVVELIASGIICTEAIDKTYLEKEACWAGFTDRLTAAWSDSFESRGRCPGPLSFESEKSEQSPGVSAKEMVEFLTPYLKPEKPERNYSGDPDGGKTDRTRTARDSAPERRESSPGERPPTKTRPWGNPEAIPW